MKLYNETSIRELNRIKEEKANRDNVVQSLGAELTQEKLKNMQKDIIITSLGQEITKVKLDVMQIKGGK